MYVYTWTKRLKKMPSYMKKLSKFRQRYEMFSRSFYYKGAKGILVGLSPNQIRVGKDGVSSPFYSSQVINSEMTRCAFFCLSIFRISKLCTSQKTCKYQNTYVS